MRARRQHSARRTVAHTTAGAVAVHTVPTRRRREQFQLVDGVNRYRAGQQEVDGTIMLYGAVGGHMCSFAQLTDYSRGLEVGRRKACLLYTSPSPRDATLSRMPSSA